VSNLSGQTMKDHGMVLETSTFTYVLSERE
jgi:hypothetical protein